MILEHALLQVRPGQSGSFTEAIAKARALIARAPGFRSIEVCPAVEEDDRFLLLVGWDDVESHRDGFRQSEDYQQWKALLHDFYEPMPVVTYFGESLFDD